MVTAIVFLLGLAAGWLIPRDTFPWMRRLSAWLMRERDNRAVAWGVVTVAGALLLIIVASGCSRQEPTFSTGRTISAAELPGVKGDRIYAEVNAAALPAMYETYTGTLNHLGLVHWDERFDCNHITSLYIASVQVRHAAQAWHSSSKAQTLALAEVWYRPNPDDFLAPGHAVVEARTDQGVKFIEPQTGTVMRLTPEQEASIFFRQW